MFTPLARVDWKFTVSTLISAKIRVCREGGSLQDFCGRGVI